MAKNRMQQEFDKRDQRLEVRLNKYTNYEFLIFFK